jgi:hypothetical protein
MSIRMTTRQRGPAVGVAGPAGLGAPHVGIVVTAGAVCAVLALACRLAQEVWGLLAGEAVEIAAPIPGTALYATQILVTPLVVVGLFAYQQGAFRRFGEVAFVTALLGTVAWAAGAAHGLLDVFANGGRVSDDISTGELVSIFVGFGLYCIGLVLFGIATWRAGVLPRVPAALLFTGIPLGLALEVLVPGILVVYSAGLAWLAVSAAIRLRSGSGTATGTTAASA